MRWSRYRRLLSVVAGFLGFSQHEIILSSLNATEGIKVFRDTASA